MDAATRSDNRNASSAAAVGSPQHRRQRRRFLADLHRYGPQASPQPISLRRANAYCRRLARNHYENFTVVSRFVPRDLRQDFCNIYAWCRWADDLADETDSPQQAAALLEWWQRELSACFAGEASHPVTIALHETISRYAIPAEPFLDLLVAFRQDQQKFRYDTFEELLDYCRHSADPVGRLVLHLARCATPERIALSDSICTGLQLANFWQDVAVDFARGRMYIPQSEFRRFHCDLAVVARGEADDAFRLMMRSLVDQAEAYLKRGVPLVAKMPSDLRVPIALFIAGGSAICRAIREVEYDVLTRRPELSKLQKIRLVARTWWSVKRGRFGAEVVS
ncbi:MAG: squalene synthase HpnC [Planctomycetota bacterium]|nr:MAG: squalene synthase HpnC [Planctomycetota bacterium]